MPSVHATKSIVKMQSSIRAHLVSIQGAGIIFNDSDATAVLTEIQGLGLDPLTTITLNGQPVLVRDIRDMYILAAAQFYNVGVTGPQDLVTAVFGTELPTLAERMAIAARLAV